LTPVGLEVIVVSAIKRREISKPETNPRGLSQLFYRPPFGNGLFRDVFAIFLDEIAQFTRLR